MFKLNQEKVEYLRNNDEEIDYLMYLEYMKGQIILSFVINHDDEEYGELILELNNSSSNPNDLDKVIKKYYSKTSGYNQYVSQICYDLYKVYELGK